MNDRLATGRIVPYVQLNYPDNRVTFNCKPKQQLEEL